MLQDIENELDRTQTKLHDQSQISNAVPSSSYRRQKDEYEGFKILEPQQRQRQSPPSVILVGHNRVPIPKFDPLIIEKYNQLNIEGKLPHIVETNKFDPECVKEQVKELFRQMKKRYAELKFDQVLITPTNNRQRSGFPPLNSLESDSGIGNETPNSPREKSLTTLLPA